MAKAFRIGGRGQLRALLARFAAGFLGTSRAVVGFGVALGILGVAAVGAFRNAYQATPQLIALAGLCVLLVARLFERVQRETRASQKIPPRYAELELGALFVAATFVVIEFAGGPSGVAYPLVFALVAFLVTFHSTWPNSFFLTLIIGSEAAIVFLQPMPFGAQLLLSHASFNLLFAFLYATFLRTDLAARRSAMRHELRSHLSGITEAARDFRLTSSLSLDSRELTQEQLTERRLVGSVEAIRESVYHVLAVGERALQPFTIALYWLDGDERHLRIKELRSFSNDISDQPLDATEGFLGAVVNRRALLLLKKLRAGHPGLSYYATAQPVTDFLGVPVFEGPHLRGVLFADRCDGGHFSDRDVDVMIILGTEIVRAVQVEHIFADMDREKYRRERFYQASRDFNSALTVDDVARVAFAASRRITNTEFACVAVATEQTGQMQVAAVDWPDASAAEPFRSLCFMADDGLIGASIQAGHPLPHGRSLATLALAFGDQALPSLGLRHVKVLPLLWKDRGVGALVLGSRGEDFLTPDQLDMASVIADHAAIAIANAQMYERMQRMATTDGLTGLVNHRHFQALFDTALARGERYGHPMALLLSDLDHFKSVNDTYGHLVGDQVLRRVGEVLTAAARRTDVVARYGGEEFAVLMSDTDARGALRMAERIRQSTAAERFDTEHGSFTCTLSIGIATFPTDGVQKAKITECADQALYEAKRRGRNRVVPYGEPARAKAAS